MAKQKQKRRWKVCQKVKHVLGTLKHALKTNILVGVGYNQQLWLSFKVIVESTVNHLSKMIFKLLDFFEKRTQNKTKKEKKKTKEGDIFKLFDLSDKQPKIMGCSLHND